MNGHVYQRGKSWSYVVDVGRDSATGRRRQRTKGGFRTRAEAQKAQRKALDEIGAGVVAETGSLTVAKYLEQWLPTIEPDVRPTTFAGYRRDVVNIVSKIGAIKLADLTALQVEAAYADLVRSGGPAGRPLSPKTVRNAHTVLRRALGDAERLQILGRNVARLARPPRYERPEIATWTAAELRTFLDHVADERLHALYNLLATTGMRRGEALGLRWSDVNLDAGHVSISQTLTTAGSQLVFGPTKSAWSRRRLALDEGTRAQLAAHRQEQVKERLLVGSAWANERDLVFTEADGSLVHPDRLTGAFRRHSDRLGLPQLGGPHGLRHTWATLALTAGVHPKVVSERLGHATVSITLDIYSHVTAGLDSDAAETVADAIFGTA